MRSLGEILKSTGSSDVTSQANAGLSQSAAEEQPEQDTAACDRCGGAGFVRRSVRLGHPDFGRAFPCECTLNERDDQRRSRLERYSGLGALSRLTFANLSPRGRSANPAHQQRFATASAAAEVFAEAPAGWVVFSGPSGCGKTHLAAAIAGRCIDNGQAAMFMVVPDLLDHLRSAYQPVSEIRYDELFEIVRNAPLLVLDDLGAQSSTPWADEKLFQIINHRYSAQLPTVFTTNLDPADFDARIRSRLTEETLSRVYQLESGAGQATGDLDALSLPHLRSMTFKTFDPRIVQVDERDEAAVIANAHREAMKYAADPKDWLLIAGVSGRGKTRLAAAIGNYCREAGAGVMMVVVPDLLDWLRVGFGPQNHKAFDGMFEQVRTVPLLILDDLGAQSSTPWANEKLFQLLNYRYNAMLPTVITTNVTAAEIEDRIRTRLTDPQASTILLMGRFEFFARRQPAPAGPAPRGRPRRS